MKTLKAALDLGFPATIAVLSFSSYQGVRFLQGPDGCSLPLQSTRGIITGDKNSNNFARAALYNLLETAHSKYTMVQTREWVDDLVQSPASSTTWEKQVFLFSMVCVRQVSQFRPKPPWSPLTEAFPHDWCRDIGRLVSLYIPLCLPPTWVSIAGFLPADGFRGTPRDGRMPGCACTEPHKRAHHQNAGSYWHAPLSHVFQQAVGHGSLTIGSSAHSHSECAHATKRGSVPHYHAGHCHGPE